MAADKSYTTFVGEAFIFAAMEGEVEAALAPGSDVLQRIPIH